jgi:hypothetical protein
MNATETVHQSKWGYHPCSKETSKKLRTINRVYLKALRLQAAHDRWANKDPQNRVLFSTVRDESGKKTGRIPVLDKQNKPVPMPEPKLCKLPAGGLIFEWTYKYEPERKPRRISKMGEAMLEASRQARKPVENPDDVKPLGVRQADIDRLYEQCVAWESA